MAEDQRAVPTVDFDHRDEQSHVNPWPRWKQMRAECPVHYADVYGGFYVIPRYRDVVEAARNPVVFSSADKTTIPPMDTPRLRPIHTDPPESRQWREIINPHFSPARVAEYEPWIAELVAEIVDPLLAAGRFDVPRDIGIPLTRTVILRIMGITDGPPELNEWTDDAVFGVGERAQHGAAMIISFLTEQIARHRKSPDSGLISLLLTQELESEGGRLLEDDEILKLLLLVLMAGLETTSAAISATVSHLVENPDDVARLMAEPKIWRLAMDEFIRWASPAVGLARTARSDSEVGGCPVPAGSRVMLLYGSANRDQNEFPDPNKVVLDRHPNRHVGFGMGPHRCLGSHLAKTQMRLTLERLLPTLGEYRIEDKSKLVWKAAVTRGFQSLPLTRL
ncbi:cytochrome P450 [Streptomyces sp. CA-106131]|uniref:cytochrome P450 n=1 Tax=Streptomyces sp. CA-106131 TaxID=3240045 RepID=UPI003D92C992